MSMQPNVTVVFKEVAQQVTGNEFETLTLDTKFAELSLDSVAVMEIVGLIEDRLSIRFNDSDLAHLITLGDLQTLVEKTGARS